MLDIRVVCFLRDYIHVVEREVFELCCNKVIFSGFPRHNVCEVQSITHSGGPVEADTQQAQEKQDHHNLQQSTEPRGQTPRDVADSPYTKKLFGLCLAFAITLAGPWHASVILPGVTM